MNFPKCRRHSQEQACRCVWCVFSQNYRACTSHLLLLTWCPRFAGQRTIVAAVGWRQKLKIGLTKQELVSDEDKKKIYIFFRLYFEDVSSAVDAGVFLLSNTEEVAQDLWKGFRKTLKCQCLLLREWQIIERKRARESVCVCAYEVNLWSGVTALPFLATDRAQLVQLAWLTSLFLQQCVFHPGPSSRLLRLSCLFNQSTRRHRRKKDF